MNYYSPIDLATILTRHLRSTWHIISIILFLSFHAVPSLAQDTHELMKDDAFIHDVRQAIDSVYNMNYDASVHILEPWQKKYPDHPFWIFWDGLHTWWKILPDLENKQYDKKLVYDLSQAEYRSSRLLNKDSKNLDALLIKSASDAFLARFYANRDKWLKAFQYGKTSINTVFAMKDAYPDFSDLGFGLGAYNYYSAWLPQQYPVLKTITWLMPKGDKVKGLHLLRAAADSSILVKPEAIYTLARIYLEAEQKSDSALYYFDRLARMYPQNLYYQTLFAYTLFREKHYPEVLFETDKLLADSSAIEKKPYGSSILEHLYILRAMVNFDMGDYVRTLSNSHKSRKYSLDSPEGKKRYNYALSGYLIGRAYEQIGKKTEAKEFYLETARLKSDSPYIEKAQDRLKQLGELP